MTKPDALHRRVWAAERERGFPFNRHVTLAHVHAIVAHLRDGRPGEARETLRDAGLRYDEIAVFTLRNGATLQRLAGHEAAEPAGGDAA